MVDSFFKRDKYRLPARRDVWLVLSGAAFVSMLWAGLTVIHHQQLPLKPQSNDITIAWLPKTVTRWRPQIDEMAKKYQLDPNLVAIIMTVESGGYSKAKSEDNAVGLMQITPLTAKDIASRYLKQPTTHYNLKDPRTNIEFGTAYLAELRKQFGSYKQGPSWDSTVELVAVAYNGGFLAGNKLEQGKGLNTPEIVVYSRDVFNMWRERQAGKSPTYDRWVERGGNRLLDQAKSETH